MGKGGGEVAEEAEEVEAEEEGASKREGMSRRAVPPPPANRARDTVYRVARSKAPEVGFTTTPIMLLASPFTKPATPSDRKPLTGL